MTPKHNVPNNELVNATELRKATVSTDALKASLTGSAYATVTFVHIPIFFQAVSSWRLGLVEKCSVDISCRWKADFFFDKINLFSGKHVLSLPPV